MSATVTRKLPAWFKQEIPDPHKIQVVKNILTDSRIATVCASARCPNQGACWEQKIATVMILGEVCSRWCRFCAVQSGEPRPVDKSEPLRVAAAIAALGLRYVVITSVTRDDLKDGGAEQFSRTVHVVRGEIPDIKIELLVPDFQGHRENIATVVNARPHVLAHNLETVRRLSPLIRPSADYERSLSLIGEARRLEPDLILKSGLMVGLGETTAEVVCAMKDLRAVGCDILTIGQYLSPTATSRHVPVIRYVDPAEFADYRRVGLAMGFRAVKRRPWSAAVF